MTLNFGQILLQKDFT